MTRSIKNSLLVCACVFASIPACAQTSKAPQTSPSKRDINAAWAINAPHSAPLRWFASTDPKHKNEDYILLKPGETRRVALAAGNMVRVWSTAAEPDKIELALATSGAPIPLLVNGKAARGTFEDKTFLWYPSTAEFDRTPVALLVTNRSSQPNKWFYQVAIRPQSTVVFDRTASAPIVAQTRIERATGEIAPGQQLALNIEAKFPSLVRALRIRFAEKTALETLRLRVFDATGNLVDVPLASLVGGFSESAQPLQDAMTSWDGTTLELRWPMPFAKPLQIEISNSGATANATTANATTAKATIEADIARVGEENPFRFRAAFGSARNVRKQAIPILQTKGAGAFVGLRMAISPVATSARRAFAYLEGNEILVADGQKFEGTGTEDFFNSAWYFPDKPFAREYGGLTEKNALPPRAAMYRLMLPDAIPFRRDFRFDFEHGNNNNSDDLEYRWVAFWYQKEGGTAQIADALAGSATSENAASGGEPNNALDFARTQGGNSAQNAGRGVRSNSPVLLPPLAETALGLVLFVTSVWALLAIFRRPKKDSSKNL